MKSQIKKIIIAVVIILMVLVGVFLFPIVEIIYLNSTKQTELIVKNNTLYMDGLINSRTPKQFKEMFTIHPQIDTLIMKTVEGSVDDEANLKVAEWIAQKHLTFVLEPESLIASGGTDFFLAGKNRIVHKGAKVGVHSWAGESETATDFPVGHEYHLPYINYYKSIGFSQQQAEDFYYFTINAAPADDIYWMTREEVKKYRITTAIN